MKDVPPFPVTKVSKEDVGKTLASLKSIFQVRSVRALSEEMLECNLTFLLCVLKALVTLSFSE